MINQSVKEKMKECSRKHYLKNRESILKNQKEYYLVPENKKRRQIRNKKWRLKNKDKIQKKSKLYQQNHQEQIKDYRKKHYVINKERIKKRHQKRYLSIRFTYSFKKKRREYQRKLMSNPVYREKMRILDWQYRNRPEIKEKRVPYMLALAKKRYKTNPSFKINHDTAHFLNHCLKKGYMIPILKKYLNFTIPELKKHIESKFKEGMSWENRRAWHLDHLKPMCLFKVKKYGDSEYKKCWAMSNLQPLWRQENYLKGSKIG